MTNAPETEFAEMAERIKRTAGDTFGGAAVIVPPDGEPISLLILDSGGSEIVPQFFAMVKSRLDLALAELEASLRGVR